MRRLSSLLILSLIALSVAAGAGASDSPAYTLQTCVVREDWGLYTVVRGDSLWRIARRFNSTASQLMVGNCLRTAVIHAGQQLRVPNAGQSAPGVSAASTFQAYENGFMIWRGDTGAVLVFVYSGKYLTFGSMVYGWMPDNPFMQPTPPQRVRPIMGFGKVWGNFPDVRSALGWAVSQEQSYTASVYASPGEDYRTINLPDGRTVKFSPTGWSFVGGSVPVPTQPPPTPTPPYSPIRVAGTFQQFENGFMIWRGDVGTIWAFYGTSAGMMGGYPPSSYGGLPDRFTGTAPAGKFRPILGFGKVWSNFPDVRANLGWATGSEIGYTMTFQDTQTWPGFTVTLPNGRTVYTTRSTFWNLSPDGGGQVTPGPGNPLVVTTRAAYQPYEGGFTVWREDTGTVEVYLNAGSRYLSFGQSSYGSLPDNPVTDTPPEGRVKPIRGFGKVWGNFPDVRTGLGWATANEEGFSAIYRTVYFSAQSQACLNVPYGLYVSVWHSTSGYSTWRYVDGCQG